VETFARPGIYRRRIQVATEPGKAYALLEDDPHCYRAVIEHDGVRVTAARGDALRTPWDLCANARGNLQRLVGMPLRGDALAAREFTDASQQCTHLFDAASLAIAHAARGVAKRRYDISVECLNTEPRHVQMHIDDQPFFSGAFENYVFVEPEQLWGVPTRKLYEWALQHESDVDRQEAMWVLRRAIYIASNRLGNLDENRFAIEVSPGMGACYVYQPGVADKARRMQGSTRDFSESTAAMLQWSAVSDA
jgi:hypothetical protein